MNSIHQAKLKTTHFTSYRANRANTFLSECNYFDQEEYFLMTFLMSLISLESVSTSYYQSYCCMHCYPFFVFRGILKKKILPFLEEGGSKF